MNTPISSPRIVLDTNIWLDIFVFNDLHTQKLATQWQTKQIAVMINTPCFNELQITLNYSRFANKNLDKNKILQTIAQQTHFINDPFDASNIHLPQCKDRDDQKFLELAYITRSSYLITKDKALLKLNPKISKHFNLIILDSKTWAAMA